jgi:uncharacterized membrane protein YhaH (DUF805 family)
LVDALRRGTARAWSGLLVAYACTVPALVLMAWWNADNCWPNLMFNFVNRHEGAGTSWQTPLLYVLTLIYALGPPALLMLKSRRWRDGGMPGPAPLGVLAWLPLLLFAGLSLVKQIGLHWLLSFVPFTLIWLGLRLQPSRLRTLGVLFTVFAALHVVVILAVSRLPLETWQKTRLYDGIVLTFEHRALARELDSFGNDWVLAMDGYSSAATLGYNLRRYMIVFGPGSSHARQDDMLTDFRALAGKNILILRKAEPAPDEYRPYFDSIEIDSFEVRSARFWRVQGKGFDYPAYRDGVLAPVRQKYYQLPDWLPQTACYLCDRYFPEQPCRR